MVANQLDGIGFGVLFYFGSNDEFLRLHGIVLISGKYLVCRLQKDFIGLHFNIEHIRYSTIDQQANSCQPFRSFGATGPYLISTISNHEKTNDPEHPLVTSQEVRDINRIGLLTARHWHDQVYPCYLKKNEVNDADGEEGFSHLAKIMTTS